MQYVNECSPVKLPQNISLLLAGSAFFALLHTDAHTTPNKLQMIIPIFSSIDVLSWLLKSQLCRLTSQVSPVWVLTERPRLDQHAIRNIC